MKWRVRLLDGARREMRRAAANYEHERDGLVIASSIKSRRFEIRSPHYPSAINSGPRIPNIGRLSSMCFLVVFYRIDEVRRTLVIVAIAHTRREPGYWKARLEP